LHFAPLCVGQISINSRHSAATKVISAARATRSNDGELVPGQVLEPVARTDGRGRWAKTVGELRQHLVARGVHEGSVDLSARAGNESETLSARQHFAEGA